MDDLAKYLLAMLERASVATRNKGADGYLRAQMVADGFLPLDAVASLPETQALFGEEKGPVPTVGEITVKLRACARRYTLLFELSIDGSGYREAIEVEDIIKEGEGEGGRLSPKRGDERPAADAFPSEWILPPQDEAVVAKGAATGKAIREAISARNAGNAPMEAEGEDGEGQPAAKRRKLVSEEHGDEDGTIALPSLADEEVAGWLPSDRGADGTLSAQRTLYLGNLNEAKTSGPVLHELAIQAGPVRRLKLMSGYALVEYESAISLHYALRLFSGLVFHGLPLKAQAKTADAGVAERSEKEPGEEDAEQDEETHSALPVSLFIRPMPVRFMDETDLRDLGSLACDAVTDARIASNGGYGFITFRSAKDANVAVAALSAALRTTSLFGPGAVVRVSDESQKAMAARDAEQKERKKEEKRNETEEKGQEEGIEASAAAGKGEDDEAPPLVLGGSREGKSSGSGGGGAGGSGAGGRLPVTPDILLGLRIEAIQAHCRKIAERGNGNGNGAGAGAAVQQPLQPRRSFPPPPATSPPSHSYQAQSSGQGYYYYPQPPPPQFAAYGGYYPFPSSPPPAPGPLNPFLAYQGQHQQEGGQYYQGR